VKQSQSIEIAYLINGEVVSVRRLSKRSEWRSALAAFGMVAVMSAATAAIVATAMLVAHRVLFLPTYLGLWAAVGLGAAALAATRAAHRARSYNIGAAIDDDAFSALALPLVRRTPSGYRLAIVPGFTGRIDGDRAPLAVEGLAQGGRPGDRSGVGTDLPLEIGMRAEVVFGPATFVVRAFPGVGPAPSAPVGLVRRFARRAFLPLELAALASIFCAVPVGAQIGDADMKSAISSRARPGRSKRRCAPRRRPRRARCISASTSFRSPASTRATSAWGSRFRARGRCGITGSLARPTAPTARSSNACPRWSRPGSSSRCRSRCA
jgi:hypothetical protein